MVETKSKLQKLTQMRLFWPITALLIVLLYNFIFTDGFFNIEIRDDRLFGRPIDILKNSAPLMLIAIGMTLVVATKGIDISVGSVVAISGAITAAMVGGDLYTLKYPYYLAILVALVVSTLLGMWNGFLVAKLKIQPVVATLILMTAGRGIAQLITEGQIITVYYKPYNFLGAGYIPFIKLPFSLIVVLIVLILTIFIVKNTALGLFIQSIGINKNASRYSGISVNKIIFLTYAFCGLCAGIAGLIISSDIKAADGNNAGILIELDAILAVALGANSLNGGKFSILASAIGALVIQTITTTMYANDVSPQQLPVIKGIVVIIICLVQSESFRTKLSNIFKNRRHINETVN